MTIPGSIWSTLGVAATRDVGAIKRAYAIQLRITRPDDDPEGFQRLRAAYEAALALAEQSARAAAAPAKGGGPAEMTAPAQTPAPEPITGPEETPVAEPGRGSSTKPTVESQARGPTGATPRPGNAQAGASPVAVSQPSGQPEEIAAVRAAFDALWLALRPNSTRADIELRSLLGRVLDLIAQSRLAVQADAENALARLLTDMSPRSDPLLEECIRRFGWEKQESLLSVDPAVLRVLARARDIASFESLKTGHDPLADAFSRLRKPANPVRRWLRANVTQAQRWPELKLLARLKDGNPTVLRELDSAEVAWWEEFQKRPKLSSGILTIGAVLMAIIVFVAVVSAAEGGSWREAALRVLASAAVLVGVLVSKLYAIDWPTFLVTNRWRGRPPLRIELGWLPLVVLMSGVAVIFRQSPLVWWAAAAIGVVASLWAIYVSGPMPPLVQRHNVIPTNSHVIQALMLNAALAWWWFISTEEFAPTSHAPFVLDAGSVGAVALMCAGVFGIRALRSSWTYRLTDGQRKRCTLALAVCAVGLGVLVRLGAASTAWRPLIAWLVVTFIVVHRVPCIGFRSIQIRARVLALLFSMAFALGLEQSRPSADIPAPVIQLAAIVLLAVALFNLLVVLADRGRRHV